MWAGLHALAAQVRLQWGWAGVSAALSGLFLPSEGRWQELRWPESRVHGCRKRRPSAWEQPPSHLVLSPSVTEAPSPSSLTRRTGGRGLKWKPSPPAVSPGTPVPAAATSPWRTTRQCGPAQSGLLIPSFWCPPGLSRRSAGGSTEARPGSRRRRGPCGHGGTAASLSQGSDGFARKVQGLPPPRGQSAPAWGTAGYWGALDEPLSVSGPGGRRCRGLVVLPSETGLCPVGGAHVWAPGRLWCLGPCCPIPVRSPLPLPSTPNPSGAAEVSGLQAWLRGPAGGG